MCSTCLFHSHILEEIECISRKCTYLHQRYNKYCHTTSINRVSYKSTEESYTFIYNIVTHADMHSNSQILPYSVLHSRLMMAEGFSCLLMSTALSCQCFVLSPGRYHHMAFWLSVWTLTLMFWNQHSLQTTDNTNVSRWKAAGSSYAAFMSHWICYEYNLRQFSHTRFGVCS